MILVVPHFSNTGGAGKYITNLLKALGGRVDVKVSGKYQSDYFGIEQYKSAIFFSLSLILFPNYKGVSKRATGYYFLKAVLCTPYLFFLCLTSKKGNISHIILTSSIQILHIPFLKIIYPNARVCILIQENLKFNNYLWGGVTQFFLNKYDCVVGIDREWCAVANEFGIENVYLPNEFDIPIIDVNCAPEYDAAFVGGDQFIKGFDFLLEFFEKYSESKMINILLLGYYSEKSIIRIRRLNEGSAIGSKLSLVGQVPDCNSYLLNSKILLLPIMSAHFCRPAIEAGLLKKTFLITELDGISDFSEFDYNCKSFRKGSLEHFSSQFFCMIDTLDLSDLENRNYENSLSFTMSGSMELFFSKLGI
tara:strand:- start:8256 stop:9344 length:1089 start_codon:yes stop_codon:yes gene_type:complete